MKRIFLLSSILLLSAVWAAAQYEKPEPGMVGMDSSGADKTTVQGCLAGSAGSYSLTDKSGTTYQLTGDTAKLQAHVGHTIEVTGTTMSNQGSTGQSGSMSAPSEMEPTINVTSFKHVSTSCSATQ